MISYYNIDTVCSKSTIQFPFIISSLQIHSIYIYFDTILNILHRDNKKKNTIYISLLFIIIIILFFMSSMLIQLVFFLFDINGIVKESNLARIECSLFLIIVVFENDRLGNA